MATFLGMEAKQPGKVIKLHLDSYIQEVLKDYKEYIKKSQGVYQEITSSEACSDVSWISP